MLIVIMIIGILAAMIIMSSSEAVTTAKASNIITNLHTLRKAVLEWYINNREKVQPDGRVKIGNESKPVQQWNDEQLHISEYLSNGNAFNFNQGNYHGLGQNTELAKGYYGIYDAGEVPDDTDRYYRRTWYVGYCFQNDEDAVKAKVMSRAQSNGLVFSDQSDPYDLIKIELDNSNADSEHQRENTFGSVWLLVF